MAALKKGSKAAKDFMAKIRAAKGKTKPKKVGATKILVKKKQSGEANRKYDKLVQALPSGKRKTGKTHYANGKKITHSTTYTETRKNRSDKGKLLGNGGLNFSNKNMVNNLGYGEVYDTSFQIYLVKFTNLSFQLWAVTGEGLKKAINHPAGKGQKPIVYIVKSYGIPKFEKMKISELKKFI